MVGHKTIAMFLLLLQIVPYTIEANPLYYAKGKSLDEQHSVMSKLLMAPLNFYSSVLSSFDGDRCPSYPSCSLYSREAINKHGALIGFWMTVDRLIHERTEVQQAPLITISNGENRFYDPLRDNDFWIE